MVNPFIMPVNSFLDNFTINIYSGITDRCYEAIKIALSLSGQSEYLFHHPDGRWLIKDSYESYLRRICARLGINTSNNHAFRVALNGRLVDANLDVRDRCLVLGHSIQTNERHYSFSDRRKAERIKEILNQHNAEPESIVVLQPFTTTLGERKKGSESSETL